MPTRMAVIPTNGRPCLNECIEAIAPQVDTVFLINTTNKPLATDHKGTNVHVVPYPHPELNISKWWNLGLDMAEAWAFPAETWDVAVLNDDALVPAGWFEGVRSFMRHYDAKAGCSGAVDIVWHEARAVPLDTRMQGFAFMLAGEAQLRAHPDLAWYFSDDYIDWESRQIGGMAMVKGFPVNHLYPNAQLTPELQIQTAKDAQTFVDIYGSRPW